MIFNNKDHIWRNVCSLVKTISQTLRKKLEEWVTLVKISYVEKTELNLIKWVGNESNYLKMRRI